jgi:hypothetical protein
VAYTETNTTPHDHGSSPLHPPTLHSITQVKVHHTSIECTDDIVITQPLIQHILFPCPWRTQYESLPSNLCRIIGPHPTPTPPQLFQNFPSSTNIRSGSDGSVLHFLGYQGWLVATLDNVAILESFGATDGRVEDTHSYRAELCGNIATFSIINIIRRVYVFVPTYVELTATWRENTLNVFDKTKPDSDVIMVARSAILEIQQFSTVKALWVSSHTDKRPPILTARGAKHQDRHPCRKSSERTS